MHDSNPSSLYLLFIAGSTCLWLFFILLFRVFHRNQSYLCETGCCWRCSYYSILVRLEPQNYSRDFLFSHPVWSSYRQINAGLIGLLHSRNPYATRLMYELQFHQRCRRLDRNLYQESDCAHLLFWTAIRFYLHLGYLFAAQEQGSALSPVLAPGDRALHLDTEEYP